MLTRSSRFNLMDWSIKSVVVIVVLMFSSCNNDNELRDPKSYYSETVKLDNNELILCDISKIKTKKFLPLSKLVDDCQMVFLETSEASLLPELRQHAISENYICVSGSVGPVKLFKRDGSYICDIGKIGRGPGEYGFTPYQILINENENSIFLLPSFNVDQILHYDLTGNFIGSISMLFKSPKAKIWITGDTITVASMVFNEETPVVYQQSFEGKLINTLPVYDYLIQKPDFSNEIFSSNTSNFDFQIISIDTLYHFNKNNNRIVPQLSLIPFPGKAGQVLREFPNYYFGACYVKINESEFDTYDFIIDKHTLKTSFFELENDFYGGIPIRNIVNSWEFFSASIPALKVITYINETLRSNKLDTKLAQKLKDILSKLDENDNDILFIGKFTM